MDGVFVAHIIRLAGAEVGERRSFAGDRAEGVFDEPVGMPDPCSRGPRQGAKQCDKCCVFFHAGER